jgi:hypothetical protein
VQTNWPNPYGQSFRALSSASTTVTGTAQFRSLRDYLSGHLDDVDLICDFASAAQKADWASRLWDYVRTDKLWSPQRHILSILIEHDAPLSF